MTITVKATYENGVLKPKEPLTLADGTEVQLSVTPVHATEDPLAHVIGIGDSGRADGADRHDQHVYGKLRP